MNRTSLAALASILSVTASAAAEPPGAAAAPIPLARGDSVAFELSRLPDAFEGEGKAVCVGTRISATGPVEARCERPFRFEVPVGDARMVYTFLEKGGRETRIELPITRAAKPVTFVAPADGSLQPPPPTTPFPEEAAERAARKAAGRQCGACAGEGFTLESVEVTKRPGPPDGTLPVRLAVTSMVRPASAK